MGVIRDKTEALGKLLMYRSRRSKQDIERDIKKLRNQVLNEEQDYNG